MLRKLTFFLLLAAFAVAQPTTTQPVIPDTPPGRLLKQWLQLFNAGNAAGLGKFTAEHGTSRPDQTPKQRAEQAMEFRERVGGFDLQAIQQSSDTEVAALVKERAGVGWARLVLKVDPAKPDVMASLAIERTPPPEGAVQREGQEALAKDVGQFVEKLASDDKFSGVVLIAKDGKPFFLKAYGYADREKKIPNDIDTKFRIGSMNKMFTSVAIAQLVQQGKLKYTDTVATLLPDYPNKEAAAKITVHQLLTHTSGLGDFFGPEFDQKKDNIRDLKGYLQFFATQPLQFEPGDRFSYSNAGMIVAGLIVERVSGQNYFEYVSEHIYKPAGMKDSGSSEKTKPLPDQAIGYMEQDGKLVSNYQDLPLMGSSAGGGDSTAPDLLRFDQALRSHKLLNEELTNTILTGKVSPGGDLKYGYGFGEQMVEGKRVVGHSGGAPGMNGNLDMYWDSGYTVVVLANRDPPIAGQISDYISQKIKQ